MISRPHHVVVGAHGEDTGGGNVRVVIQDPGTGVLVENLTNAAFGDDLVIAGLHVQACLFGMIT